MTIHLTDDQIETGVAIRVFLDCLYSEWGSLFAIAKVAEDDVMAKLGELLEKYNCSPTEEMLALMIENRVTHKEFHPMDAFTLGAKLGSISLCAFAIEQGGEKTWQTSTRPRLGDNVKGISMFDLRAMSVDDFEKIPLRYSHALLRTTLTTDMKVQRGKGSMDWKKVSQEFAKLMEDDESESAHIVQANHVGLSKK